MIKDELIKKEYQNYKEIFKNADPVKLQLADDLFNKAAFLKVQLEDLERQIKKSGAVQYSTKGNSRISIAYKTYLQSVTVYQGIVKSIDKIMDNTTDEEDDSFDEFLKNIESR